MSAEDAITVEVTRTQRDYFEGVMANLISWPWGFLRLFIPPLIGMTAIYMTSDYLPLGERLNETFGLGSILLGFMFLLTALIVGWSAWRAWSAPGALDRITYTFTPEGFGVKTAMGEGQTKWAIWKRASETQSVILIRHQLNMMHILPKRDIDPATLTKLKALLRRVLKGRVQFQEAVP